MSGKYELHSLKFGSGVDEGKSSGGGVAKPMGGWLALEFALALVFPGPFPFGDGLHDEHEARRARPRNPMARIILIFPSLSPFASAF
jgi:hypothetical protein